MGLMDKVKAQAEQALEKGKQGVAQGQAKVKEMQAKKAAEKDSAPDTPDAPAGDYKLDDV